MFDDQTNNSSVNNNHIDQAHGIDQPASASSFGGSPALPATPDPAGTSGVPVVAPTVTSSDDLVEIKKKALDELSPLVGKLEQTPEEKYKTLMMMIQASDNQGLVREAYQAAQKITDEKARAEALLNIVNEINYFTQKSGA